MYNFVVVVLFIVAMVYLVGAVCKYHYRVSKQNMRIMQLYLDQEFIAKLLSIANSTSSSNISALATSIYEYYQLNNIIFYDTSKHEPLYQHVKNSRFVSFIRNSEVEMLRAPNGFYIDNNDKRMYIFAPGKNSESKVVAILVKNIGENLDKQDIKTIESVINKIIQLFIYHYQCIKDTEIEKVTYN